MKESKEKRNILPVAIIILLLLLVCVLLWFLLRPQPELTKIPTGNIDVFDIRIGCLCRGKDKDGKTDDGGDDECGNDADGFYPNVSPGASSQKKDTEKKINGDTDTDVDDAGIVYVDDDNGWYVYQKNLEIFNNAAFEYTNKIAPGVSNSYDFKVHNETSNTIRYNIEFAEESEYAINMKYRLKRAGAYVVGSETEWVNASQLLTAMKQLVNDGVDSYTLDWMWPYEDGKDDQDTEAGKNMESEYYLGIKVNFEGV